MTFGDVLAGIAVIAAAVITLCASTVLVYLAFSRQVRFAAQTSLRSPIRSGVKGVVIIVLSFFCFVAFSTTTVAIVKIALALLLIVPTFLVLLGSAVLVAAVSSVVVPNEERYPSPKALLGRALLCLAACLTPFVGWFVVAPFLLLFAAGSGMECVAVVIKDLFAPAAAQRTEVLL